MGDRILMIEDDESLSAMLTEYLGSLGIDLCAKPNAEAGLYALADGHYDQLPQVDAQALEKIRADAIALADSASKTLMNAVADVTEVLTIEQRQELAAMIGRHQH